MTYNFRIKQQKLTKDILHLEFPNIFALTATLLRPQEFYENPDFIGKVGFTLEDYMDWEYKDDGRFEYYENIDGCNMTRETLIPFYDGDFDPLSKKEKRLLRVVEPHMTNPNLYIIGTHKDSARGILQHEAAHGLFGTNQRYMISATGLVEGIKLSDKRKLNKFMTFHNYDRSVWTDEIHAYVMVDTSHLREENIRSIELTRISKVLNRNFERYIDLKDLE